jgi:hypothetical protein
MGKKKVSNVGKLLSLVALVAGVAAFIMMFLDAIKITADFGIAKNVTTYKGSEVAFGLKDKIGSMEVTILNFNLIALITFLLPLAGGVISYLFKNKLFTLIAFLCFVIGAIALFAFGPIFAIGLEIPDTYSRSGAEAVLRSTPTLFTQSSTTPDRVSDSFF